MSKLRLVFSILTNRFYVGKMTEKNNVLICKGVKTDVTNDFMDCMISYLYGEYKNDDVKNDTIETIVTANLIDGTPKKYRLTIKDISDENE